MAPVACFCRRQTAECILEAWKNAFGHGSARSGKCIWPCSACVSDPGFLGKPSVYLEMQGSGFGRFLNIQIPKRREPPKDSQMHFPGPGKCIWALPRPRQYQCLVEPLQSQRKARVTLQRFQGVCLYALLPIPKPQARIRNAAEQGQMHFSGPEKCIWQGFLFSLCETSH